LEVLEALAFGKYSRIFERLDAGACMDEKYPALGLDAHGSIHFLRVKRREPR
jgi:hypothetical protein